MTEDRINTPNCPTPRRITVRHEYHTNGMAVAGFVLALIGLFLSWVPVVGWIIWLLGLLFSLIGIFKRPRGLAIAGIILSLIGFVILVAFVGMIAALVMGTTAMML